MLYLPLPCLFLFILAVMFDFAGGITKLALEYALEYKFIKDLRGG